MCILILSRSNYRHIAQCKSENTLFLLAKTLLFLKLSNLNPNAFNTGICIHKQLYRYANLVN